MGKKAKISIVLMTAILIVLIVVAASIVLSKNSIENTDFTNVVENVGVERVPDKYSFKKEIEVDGKVFEFYQSGDQQFKYDRDKDGNVLIPNEDRTNLEYLTKVDGKIIGSGVTIDQDSSMVVKISVDDLDRNDPRFTLETVEVMSQNRLSNNTTSETKISIKNLVVYVTFPDDESTPDIDAYLDVFARFDNYYKEVTQNRIVIDSIHAREADGSVYIYTAPNERSYYNVYGAARRTKEHELMRDICVNIATKFPDLTADDIDQIGPDGGPDGCIDSLSILVADSREPTWNGLLWPHRWNVRGIKGAKDDDPKMLGKWFGDYSFNFVDSLDIGVACHEMAHVLSAPDYYHYQYDFVPVGEWDLMADTKPNPQYMLTHTLDKYLKCVNPDEIYEVTESGTYTAYAISLPRGSGIGASQPLAYKIATKRPNEYIMVEMRTKTSGYDWVLPGTGLIVYRVIEGINGNRTAIYGKSNRLDEVFVYRPYVYSQLSGTNLSLYSSSFLDTKFSYVSIHNKYFNKVGKPLDINNRNLFESDAIYYSDGTNTGIQIIPLSTEITHSQFRIILPDDDSTTNISDKFEIINAELFEDEMGAGVKFSFEVERGLDFSLLKDVQALLVKEGQSPWSVATINIDRFKMEYDNSKSAFEGRFYLRETVDPNNIFYHSKVKTGNVVLEEEYPEHVSLVILDSNNRSVEKKVVINKNDKSWNELTKKYPSVLIYASDSMSIVVDKNGIAKTNLPVGHTGNELEETFNAKWNIEGKGPYTSISVGREHVLALRDDRTVDAHGQYYCLELDAKYWSDIVKVAVGSGASYGLTSKGTVLSIGNNTYHQMEVESWTDIIDIKANSFNVIGITRDGRVKAKGKYPDDLKQALEAEVNVAQVGLAVDYAVIVYRDGRVKAFGDIINLSELNEELASLTGIKKVSATNSYFSLLTAEGKVLTPMAKGISEAFVEKLNNLVDIVDLSCSNFHAMFLREDGVIEYVGDNEIYRTNLDFGNLVYTEDEFRKVEEIEIIDDFGCFMPTEIQLDCDENSPKSTYLTLKTIAEGGGPSTYKRLIYSTSVVEGHIDAVAEIQIDVVSHPSTGNYALGEGQDVTIWKITAKKEGYIRLNIRANGTNISKTIDIEVKKFSPLEGILIEGTKLDINGNPDLTKPSIYIQEYAIDATIAPQGVKLKVLKNPLNALGKTSLPSPTYTVEPSGLVTISDDGQIRAVKGVTGECIVTATLTIDNTTYSTQTKVKIISEIESVSSVYPDGITVFDLKYGDFLPYDKMQIKVICNIEGESVETLMGVSESMVDLTTFNPMTLGNQQVKVTYFGKTCYFDVCVKDYITHIEVVNPKVRYKLETAVIDANIDIGVIKYKKASGGDKVTCEYLDTPFGGKFSTNLIQTDLFTTPIERTIEVIYSNKIGEYLNQVRTTYKIQVVDYITHIGFGESSAMTGDYFYAEYLAELIEYPVYLEFTYKSTKVLLVDAARVTINGYDNSLVGVQEITFSYKDEFGNEFVTSPELVYVFLSYQGLAIDGWDMPLEKYSEKCFYYFQNDDLNLGPIQWMFNDRKFMTIEKEGFLENQNMYYTYETNEVGEVAGCFNKSVVGKLMYVAINIYAKETTGGFQRQITYYIPTFGILRWEIMELKEDGQFVSKGTKENPLEFTYADYDRYPSISLIALYFNPENEDEISAYISPLNISFDPNLIDEPQKLNIQFIEDSKPLSKVGSELVEQEYWIVFRDKITVTIQSSNPEYGSVDIAKVEVKYGTPVSMDSNTLTIGDAIVRALPTTQTEEFTYSFVNWTGVQNVVIEDFTILANFNRDYVNYTVTFYEEDGVTEILKKVDYHYGDVVTVPDAPTKEADKTNTYEFAGWDKEVVNVASNASYTATFTATKIDYTVTITGGSVNGEVVPTTINDGDEIEVTADDAPEGKVFDGWYVNGVKVSSDIHLTYTFNGSLGMLTLEARYMDANVEDTDETIEGSISSSSVGPTEAAVAVALSTVIVGGIAYALASISKPKKTKKK
jgi:M6 family metalloprotease-like protein